MIRTSLNTLAVAILAAACASNASASVPAAARSQCGSALRVSNAIATAPAFDDGTRLARAYHDLLDAEQALRQHPDALAAFGPLLRAARANFEAGLTAASAHSRISASLPQAAANAHDASCRRADESADARMTRAACRSEIGLPTRAPSASSNSRLQLLKHPGARRQIWA